MYRSPNGELNKLSRSNKLSALSRRLPMRTMLAALSLFVGICVAAPPEIRVIRPIEKEVTDYADFPGHTEASTTVDIRARVAGYLDKVLFEEGSLVKKGDL